MCDPARRNTYRNIWTRWVQQAYNGGFVVSERGLQAALHGALQANLPDVQVVVEPRWNVAGVGCLIPDLVLVEGGEITDIFELKFGPRDRDYPVWEDDIAHLRAYVDGNPQYPVQLNPQTGQWAAPLPVRVGCCLHFVVIADHGAQAVWPPLPGANGIKNWFGRVGGAGGSGGWDIHFP